MAINLAGLGVIYDKLSTENQQFFQLKAVPGSLTLVAIDGVLQSKESYTIEPNSSVLVLDAALPAGRWIYVISGQGGTFVPQSYVDDAVASRTTKTYVDTELGKKIDKTGGNFTGPITVQEPTQAMHPITKQMFDTLPDDLATQGYINAEVLTKANAAEVQAALDFKIDDAEKGAPNGVTENDENGKIKTYQFPESVFNDDKSFSKFGVLSQGPGQGRWFPRYHGVLKGVLGFVAEVPEGQDIRVDIRKHTWDVNGVETVVSLFPGTDRLVIPDGEKYGEYEFTTTGTFARGDSITVHVDQVGSVATGQTLSLQVEYTYLP